MNELEFQEEWLSAYLDDELTEEQRQVVEQRLAIDPAAQATLEDLQRVRAMVAKLPRWSGPDLKFAIPAELPGSLDEAEGEFGVDSDDKLDDFEEVPRSLVGADEQRLAAANANGNFNSHSMRSTLGWIAMAASVLLVAGMGYVYWPRTGLEVAHDPEPSSLAMHAETSTTLSEEAVDFGRGKMSSNGNDASNQLFLKRAPSTEREEPSRGLGEMADPAPLAMQLQPDRQADFIAPRAEEPLARGGIESKMKNDSFSIPESIASQKPAGGLGGFGEGATRQLALGTLPSDAPVAELPLPSLSNPPRGIVPPKENANGATAEDYPQDKKQIELDAFPPPTVFFARSQSWMDDEAQASLSYGQYPLRADQIVFGNNVRQGVANQKLAEVTTESILMASIKPEVANSPDFFQSIIDSNQLIAVDQPSAHIPLTAEDRAAKDLEVGGKLDAGIAENIAPATAAPVSESTSGSAAKLFSTQRFQRAIPNSPQGNSFVLFVNRDEADRVLRQLREKGQVSSQVWRVIKQPETQAAQLELGKDPNQPADAKPQQSVGGRTAGNVESTPSERVILMLNGPPS